jgi:antitoxin (DNA-binding transcriptional repressor) of toxin-antitoxin stability system
MQASVRELKGKLSAYLKRVASGEEVTVTSRGRPVAKLSRALSLPAENPGRDEIRRRLASIPGVVLGKPGEIKGSARPTKVRKGQKSIAAIVIEDRR